MTSVPNVRTMLVDRGNHAGMLYLSDPHWFGLAVMNYLKYWQARDKDYVTAVPPLDILAKGMLAGQTATYRFLVRNHGLTAVGPLYLSIELPAGARLNHCSWGAKASVGAPPWEAQPGACRGKTTASRSAW